LKLQALFKADIELAPAQELGAGPLGRRRIIAITGGRFVGERLSGRVLPGGADWQVIRADGVAELDARYTSKRRTARSSTCATAASATGPRRCSSASRRGKCRSGPILHAHHAALRDGRRALRLAEPHRLRGERRAPPTAVELEVFEVL
jgi:hypothetical protein